MARPYPPPAPRGAMPPLTPLDPLETDTVQEEYGAEFSDATLDVLRGVERPRFQNEQDSLDPLDDLEEHLQHGIRIPPATFEALQEAGAAELEGLARMREAAVDPQLQADVRYRQQLAEGTSAKDMAWLKTRAYYRGAERVWAEAAAEKAAAEAQRAAQYAVPTDRIPAAAINMTPEQLDHRRKLVAAAAAAAARRARRARGAGSTGGAARLDPDNLPELSEESEWPELQERRQGAAGAASSRGAQQQLPPQLRAELSSLLAARAAARQQGAQAAEEGGEKPAQGAGARPQRELRTVYTQAYLEQQQLSRQVQQQRQQRSMAFWLSLGLVTGTHCVRLLLRRGKRGGKGAASGSKGALASKPSASQADLS